MVNICRRIHWNLSSKSKGPYRFTWNRF